MARIPIWLRNWVPGWNSFDSNDNTSDVLGHGTAVAASRQQHQTTLSASQLSLEALASCAIRISDAAGYAYWSAAAQGLTWAADHGADVANISFEGMAASSTMQAAASYFRSKGGTVIVAAGNTGPSTTPRRQTP